MRSRAWSPVILAVLAVSSITVAQQRPEPPQTSGELLVDVSGSMDTNDRERLRWDGVSTFAQLLALSGNNGLGARYFADSDHVVVSHELVVRAKVDAFRKLTEDRPEGGATNLVPSLRNAVSELAGRPGLRYLVVLSDGDFPPGKNPEVRAICNEFVGNGGRIFFVSLVPGGLHGSSAELCEACLRNGGKVYQVPTDGRLQKKQILEVFLEIFQAISPPRLALLADSKGRFEIHRAHRSFLAVDESGQHIVVKDPKGGVVSDSQRDPFRAVDVRLRNWNVVLCERPVLERLDAWESDRWQVTDEGGTPIPYAKVFVHGDVEIVCDDGMRASAGRSAPIHAQVRLSAMSEWLPPGTTEAGFLDATELQVSLLPPRAANGIRQAVGSGKLTHRGGGRFAGDLEGSMREGPHELSVVAKHTKYSVGAMAHRLDVSVVLEDPGLQGMFEFRREDKWQRLGWNGTEQTAKVFAPEKFRVGLTVRVRTPEAGKPGVEVIRDVSEVMAILGKDGRQIALKLTDSRSDDLREYWSDAVEFEAGGPYDVSVRIKGEERRRHGDALSPAEAFESRVTFPPLFVSRFPIPVRPWTARMTVLRRGVGESDWVALQDAWMARVDDDVRVEVRAEQSVQVAEGSFRWTAETPTGEVVDQATGQPVAKLVLKPGADSSVFATAPVRLPPGNYELRVGIQSQQTFQPKVGPPVEEKVQIRLEGTGRVVAAPPPPREPGTKFKVTWETDERLTHRDESVYFKGRISVDGDDASNRDVWQRLAGQFVLEVAGRRSDRETNLFRTRTREFLFDKATGEFEGLYLGPKAIGTIDVKVVLEELVGFESPVLAKDNVRQFNVSSPLLDCSIEATAYGRSFVVFKDGRQVAPAYEDMDLWLDVALREGAFEKVPEVWIAERQGTAALESSARGYRSPALHLPPRAGHEIRVEGQTGPRTLVFETISFDVRPRVAPSLDWERFPKPVYSENESANVAVIVRFPEGERWQQEAWIADYEVAARLVGGDGAAVPLAVERSGRSDGFGFVAAVPTHRIVAGEFECTLETRDGRVVSTLGRRSEVVPCVFEFRLVQGDEILVDSSNRVAESIAIEARTDLPLRVEVRSSKSGEGREVGVGDVTMWIEHAGARTTEKPHTLVESGGVRVREDLQFEDGSYRFEFTGLARPAILEETFTVTWRSPELLFATPLHKRGWFRAIFFSGMGVLLLLIAAALVIGLVPIRIKDPVLPWFTNVDACWHSPLETIDPTTGEERRRTLAGSDFRTGFVENLRTLGQRRRSFRIAALPGRAAIDFGVDAERYGIGKDAHLQFAVVDRNGEPWLMIDGANAGGTGIQVSGDLNAVFGPGDYRQTDEQPLAGRQGFTIHVVFGDVHIEVTVALTSRGVES